MIKKYWSQDPNPASRSVITQIILKNNKLGDLIFINQIIKNSYNNDESKEVAYLFCNKK